MFYLCDWAFKYYVHIFLIYRIIVAHFKKRTSREAKQGNKDKLQLNIKKYLYIISSKDQDPKVMNSISVEEDAGIKHCVNESSVATHRIAGETFETQTNCRNNGRTFKLFPVNILNL